MFESDLVYTQDRGEVQVTFGFRARWWRDVRLYECPVQTEYGLSDDWQVQLEWDGPARRAPRGTSAANGITDLRLGTKYSFLRMKGSQFHAAVLFELGLPTGEVNKDLSEGFLEYEPSVILARDFPRLRNMQLFTQTGVALVQRLKHHADPADDEPGAHEWNWTGGFFVPLPRVVATAEFAWHTNRWNHGGRESEFYLTPGVVWKFPGRWECGVGVSFGLTRNAHGVGFSLKLTREFQTRTEEVSGITRGSDK